MKNSTGLQISNPIAGILGNTLQLGANTLLPPIFPPAERWNSAVAPTLLGMRPIPWIRTQFPRLSLTTRELAAEETAGLGVGIAILWMILLFAAARSIPKIGIHPPAPREQRFWLACGILAGGLIASGVFLAKMGSESGPRLLAPYYPTGLFAVLLLVGSRHPTRQRWWRLTNNLRHLSDSNHYFDYAAGQATIPG